MQRGVNDKYGRIAGFDEPLRGGLLQNFPVQPLLRRAAEVAAAGKHNLLIVGPAGAGKTMLAKRMPTIMPGLDIAESIEISKIYSVSVSPDSRKSRLIRTRPFQRAPSHRVGSGTDRRWEKTEAGGDISCHRRDFVP